MSRTERDFSARPALEREWMLEHTWCDACAAADLGMDAPREYEEDGCVYVEGQCRRCRRRVCSRVENFDAR